MAIRKDRNGGRAKKGGLHELAQTKLGTSWDYTFGSFSRRLNWVGVQVVKAMSSEVLLKRWWGVVGRGGRRQSK